MSDGESAEPNRSRQRVRPRGDFREFPRAEIEQSLAARFEAQVSRAPGRLAVATRDHRWSYAELNAAANRIAHAILDEDGAASEPVALLLGPGAPLIAAIVGTLKAGKIYVPLDASHPRARLEEILEEARVSSIVTDADHRDLAVSLGESRRRALEVEQAFVSSCDADPGLPVSPDAGAYIFYTSGSTGRPKGVVDEHRNVLHNVRRYTNSLSIGADDRLSLVQSCSFSGTVSSIFGALGNGAALFPFDLRTEGFSRLAEWVAAERLTIFHSVPSIFRGLAAAGRRFPELRVLRLEGDRATRHDAELYRKHLPPDCILVNGLGATETGLSRQFFVDHATPLEDAFLPVGWPVEDVRVRILDGEGRPVEDGRVGQIGVQSRYLATGYWKRPDLDRAAFRTDPEGGGERIYLSGDLGRLRPDGCLEHLGRTDFQLKIRGERVEPAAVEKALLEIEGIREAAVTTLEARGEEARLVAFVVPSRGPGPSAGRLRRSLAERLASPLVPSEFVTLDALPLDANGKVDRRALSAPERFGERSSTFVPPRDSLERRIARIWERELRVPRVGIRDDLFDLGGDSLRIARLAARIEKAVGRPVPPALLYAASTVGDLASVLSRAESWRRAADPLFPLAAEGTRSPLFLVPSRDGELLLSSHLARKLGPEQPSYAFRWTGSGARPGLPSSVEDIAAAGIACLRRVQPRGPYRLGGFCFGGVVAMEMARQLRESGQDVDLLVLVSVSPYDFPSLVTPSALARFGAETPETPAERRARRAQRLRRSDGEGTLPYLLRVGHLLAQSAGWRAIRPWRAATDRARDVAWLAACRALETLGCPIPPRLRDADRMSRRVFESYRARPDAGRVVLFLPRRSREAYSDDPERDFAGLSTGSVAVTEIPCRAGEMLLEPNVTALARGLSLLLSEPGVPLPTNRQARTHEL